MSFKQSFPDSFLIGILMGAVGLPGIYFFLEMVRSYAATSMGRSVFMPAPRIHLFALAGCLLCCRLVIINLQKEKTGKGILMALFIGTIAYLYYILKIRQAF
jgi:hypothetical protein